MSQSQYLVRKVRFLMQNKLFQSPSIPGPRRRNFTLRLWTRMMAKVLILLMKNTLVLEGRKFWTRSQTSFTLSRSTVRTDASFKKCWGRKRSEKKKACESHHSKKRFSMWTNIAYSISALDVARHVTRRQKLKLLCTINAPCTSLMNKIGFALKQSKSSIRSSSMRLSLFVLWPTLWRC